MKPTRKQMEKMEEKLNKIKSELSELEFQKTWLVGLDGFDPTINPKDKDALDDLNSEIDLKKQKIGEIEEASRQYCAA